MKFYGEPNLTVMSNKTVGFETVRYKVCKFDENGQFETDDETLINKLKPHFKHEGIKCKQCGMEFENKGLMLAHIRKEHPKGGE